MNDRKAYDMNLFLFEEEIDRQEEGSMFRQANKCVLYHFIILHDDHDGISSLWY